MRAVDTNVLVRLITRDDEDQYLEAKEFVQAGAWVSHVVLVETTWVLMSAYELRPDQIATALEMLLNHEQIHIQDPDVVSAALEQYTAKPKLGFSDCMVLEIARKAGHLPLGTFDRRLSRLDGGLKL